VGASHGPTETAILTDAVVQLRARRARVDVELRQVAEERAALRGERERERESEEGSGGEG
tara:strand:+ start:345 stop:524 length:180 start_codon:yes stop_codon:yes gene_type:complete